MTRQMLLPFIALEGVKRLIGLLIEACDGAGVGGYRFDGRVGGSG